MINKKWDEVLKEKKIETVSLDIDMDEEEVKQYEVGDVLPVFILFKREKEVKRIVGEKTTGELLSILKEVEEKV